jgi:hypothetical protein
MVPASCHHAACGAYNAEDNGCLFLCVGSTMASECIRTVVFASTTVKSQASCAQVLQSLRSELRHVEARAAAGMPCEERGEPLRSEQVRPLALIALSSRARK